MGTTVTVYLDACEDLAQAGDCYCGNCIESFTRHYRAAARLVGRLHAIKIDVVECEYDHTITDDDDDDGRFWQEIHDNTAWRGRSRGHRVRKAGRAS